MHIFKAVHSLSENKKLCIILKPWATFIQVSAFLLVPFVVSAVARGKGLPQLKNFSRNLSVRTILVLQATFVPNLMFLGLFTPQISFREKNSHLHTHPQSLFRDS